MIKNEELSQKSGLLTEQIMILAYKLNPKLVEEIFYKERCAFENPLLYSYFNSSSINDWGLEVFFTRFLLRPFKSKVKIDNEGRFYLSSIGWFQVEQKNKEAIVEVNGDDIKVLVNSKIQPVNRTNRIFVSNHPFEVMIHPLSLFEQCYYDVEKNQISVEISAITQKHIKHLTKAFNLIKQYVPEYYTLLEFVLKQVVIFNVDTTLRNSFADLTAHGTIFLNAYQEDYDEVFFVDDIAHQSGHVIMNALLFEPSEYFKVSTNFTLEKIKLGNGNNEKRDILVVYHALYTYYTTLTCLDKCLSSNVFNTRQRHEALGRMKFYLGKCNYDLMLFKDSESHIFNEEKLLSRKGWKHLIEIHDKQQEMLKKWKSSVENLKLDNQPYNFTYSKFIELNPLYE